MHIETRQIKLDELHHLIAFDNLHLVQVMKDIGIEASKCTQPLTHTELVAAHHRQDIMFWLYANKPLAGYFWREKRADCLFGVGAAIKKEFYGSGLSHYIIHLTEEMAKAADLRYCRLHVISANGRVINAYFKHGYQIVGTQFISLNPKHPPALRCIMEKNLTAGTVKQKIMDCQEVSCLDDVALIAYLDQGYVGVRFIRNDGDLANHKIVFEKWDR